MKMNKTLLITVLAAAAFGGGASSAMALTFTDGQFTGSVDISGTVTVPESTNQWQWAAGDAISFASLPVTHMTDGYKTLTLAAASNLPLLVGQTKAATVGNAGSVGLNPQIAFKDATDTTVTPVWDNTGNTGKGTVTLRVTAADGTTALGSMSMKVKVGGIRASNVDATNSFLNSIYEKPTGGTLYGLGALPSQSGILTTAASAATWNNTLGAKSDTDLLGQLNAASSHNVAALQYVSAIQTVGFDTPAAYFSGTYGLGIAQGDNIVVTFDNPVTTPTIWKAPLKMTVTYL
ncbi:hypothetical protein J3D48_006204 [Pseudomonas fluorescens]|uniref:F4 family fimbrial subunit n=1 Tax=Pseudomonas fluorescens TaxID=294 RepID=UPI0020A22446|nr:hypothetical protein [Pseudomonas fluorescens]MCP1489794.1 hypothetical protein [Pseudomonas fluorescens]